MSDDIKIILASASPRRKELLDDLGLKFEVMPTDSDESAVHEKSPRRLVKRLALLKASKIADPSAVVIGADTVVALKGRVFGKPHTVDNAVATIEALNGRWHKVYTGVAVLCGEKKYVYAVCSRVKFKKLSQRQISDYVADTMPLDKAGAYGIQDGRIVEKYRGSYSNIVGLPTERLSRILKRLGEKHEHN